MKLKRSILSILALVFLVGASFRIVCPANAASAQDFYFTDFTADYYLTKAEDGTSKLHVKEVLTAMFPQRDQNHGITRSIPITNQGGDNVVIDSEKALNFTALRNGSPEKINKIECEDGAFVVYLGDADSYVHGKQVYTLEYDFTDVITEFTRYDINVSGAEDIAKAYQELYWDTNGTAWQQSFDHLTANLHLEDDALKNLLDTERCYVGRYSDDDEDRCTISRTADGFSFTTSDLEWGENLTFVIGLKPDTFKVILKKNYIILVAFVIELLVCGLVVYFAQKKWREKAKTNYDLYKATFVAPEYQAPANLRVAEGGELMMKSPNNTYVATLLELAVTKKVSLQKVENGKYDWAVIVQVDPDSLSVPQRYMLRILADEKTLEKGMRIPIEAHKASSTLAGYARDYGDEARKNLKSKKLIATSGADKSGNFSGTFAMWFMIAWFGIPILATICGVMTEFFFSNNDIMVGGELLPFLMFVVFIAMIIWQATLVSRTAKFSWYTQEGIIAERKLEGLELYIKMAEEDRLAFLQSLPGVDISNEGIVKLYEKLLPWACLFGREKTWAKEMNKYYAIAEVQPSFDVNIADAIIVSHIVSSVNSSVVRSTSYSSGGSGSSSFSGGGGGGGGGFSGGGGGGGGGGGW